MAPRQITYSDGSTPSVCIVGTGLGGLCAAVQLKRKLGLASFTVFDRAHDIGGVWLANHYPGCQVDSPAQFYSYSFEQKTGWSKLCPDRDEYWRYLQSIAKKYDLYPHVQFRTEVKSLVWNDDSKTWTVTTVALQTKVEQSQQFQFVILATGILREPYYPPQFDSFAGPMMHSANWDSNVKIENQVVGVVGGGSSALQVVPTIAPLTKQLFVYLRNPNHMFPKPQWSHSWLARFILRLFPCILSLMRYLGLLLIEWGMRGLKADSFVNKAGSFICDASRWFAVRDKVTRAGLTPKFRFGLKIPIVSNSFYKAFDRSNVTLQSSRISKIDGQTIITEDGKSTHLDVLILCTGFKVQDYFAPIEVIGVNGTNLLDLWKRDRPHTYYGVTCREAPNLFYLVGPNTATGVVIFNIECQATFIANALHTIMNREAASIQVTESAQNESMREMEEAEKGNACTSASKGAASTWLINQNGKSTILWPKSLFTYWRRTRRINESKFEFARRGQAGGRLVEMKYRLIGEIV